MLWPWNKQRFLRYNTKSHLGYMADCLSQHGELHRGTCHLCLHHGLEGKPKNQMLVNGWNVSIPVASSLYHNFLDRSLCRSLADTSELTYLLHVPCYICSLCLQEIQHTVWVMVLKHVIVVAFWDLSDYPGFTLFSIIIKGLKISTLLRKIRLILIFTLSIP